MSAPIDHAAARAESALSVAYQGWSGCVVRAAGASTLVFDPAPDARVPDGATLLLTHGHFEHVDGALAHVRRARRAPVTVVASAPLCRYLERRGARPGDRFVRVTAGERIEVGGWRARVFAWTHMPLFPPGAAAAARYALKLAARPRELFGMALGGARGPLRHGPMLGYRVRPVGAHGALVYFGEGLHRRTSREQLAAALDEERVDALLFGAEPEDLEALPALLARHDVGRALAFEPHRAWRDGFGLPQIDLDELAARARAAGVDAAALRAGDTIALFE